MIIDYALVAVAAVVVLIIMFLRTNAAISYFALCAGTVLVASSGDNAGLIASSLTSGFNYSADIAKIALLLLPLIVLAVILRGQVHKTLLPLSFIPAVCTALLGILFVYPFLSKGLAGSISATETWDLLNQYRELIVGVGVVSSVVMITLTNKTPKDKHSKHHGH